MEEIVNSTSAKDFWHKLLLLIKFRLYNIYFRMIEVFKRFAIRSLIELIVFNNFVISIKSLNVFYYISTQLFSMAFHLIIYLIYFAKKNFSFDNKRFLAFSDGDSFVQSHFSVLIVFNQIESI